jgi:hypothetical protein
MVLNRLMVMSFQSNGREKQLHVKAILSHLFPFFKQYFHAKDEDSPMRQALTTAIHTLLCKGWSN